MVLKLSSHGVQDLQEWLERLFELSKNGLEAHGTESSCAAAWAPLSLFGLGTVDVHLCQVVEAAGTACA